MMRNQGLHTLPLQANYDQDLLWLTKAPMPSRPFIMMLILLVRSFRDVELTFTNDAFA